jgi:glycosyltransferase involved in cell wall biosynthesis
LKRIDVVRNGVSLPAEVTVKARGDGPLRLVAVGNLYPVKNHALMIEAVAALARKGIESRLTILGRGAEKELLEATARRLHVADRVELAGFREDVPAFLARSDVFVSSSLSEGMPLAFLEAMGHGLPVVASRVGGVAEIVEDGRHGLLFPCGDTHAAAQALETLARDDGLRLRLANEALLSSRESWSVDAMVGRYLEIYERIEGDLISRRRGASRPRRA